MTLGIPLVLAQLSTMAMAMTDAIIVGHGVGTEALAAMAFGLNFINIPCIALFGFSSATSIYVAHSFGSNKLDELPIVLRHGVFISLVSSVIVVSLMLLLFCNLGLVGYLGQPPELIPIARPYMFFYGAAFVFTLITGNCRAYCESQNRPWLPLYVILGAILVNAVLDYAFVYGALGLPKLGLAGAGFATLLCSAGQLVVLLYIIIRNKSLHLTLREFFRPSISGFYVKRHLKLGIPTALQIGVEIASMSVLAMFAGKLGAITLAAHHVTMQVAGFAFMIPLGFSFAVSILVSQAAGSGDRDQVRSITNSAMTFAIVWMSMSALVTIVFHNQIPKIFTQDAEVIKLAGGFLVVAGLFQVFDGIQCTAMGALRGLKDVTKPMILVTLIYWVFEMPLAIVLCFTLHLGGLGIWISMAIGLMLSATFLSLRLKRIVETKALRD